MMLTPGLAVATSAPANIATMHKSDIMKAFARIFFPSFSLYKMKIKRGDKG